MVGYHQSLASTTDFQALLFCTEPHSDFNLLQAWATSQSLKSICAVLRLAVQSCSTLWDPMDNSPPVSSVHKDSLGKNTGVGGHALLQDIFPTQVSSPGLPHCRQILYHLSHQRIPRILEWVAYPFSKESSPPRNRTRVSCIAGRFENFCSVKDPLK